MIILGSTGSIGTNALNVVREQGLSVEALVCGSNIELLNTQIKEFKPKYVAIRDKSQRHKVNHNNVYFGEQGILEILELCESKLVLNALVGFSGLKPTLKAIKLGKKVALANKESLVIAGKFIDSKNLITVDSEHFGLWYLLQDKPIKKMIITASGGSFRDTPIDKLAKVTVKQALNHPNWSMGAKITIDSATMTNKLFELLEVYHLYG
ncbi:MAG: 1-deoxy-D-xylulose 5-phosphate reductoisomerase (EC, partial [uncultured Campylobacterales bacterium]